MKVLVTGAAGFIGRRIVAEVHRKGWTVAGMARTTTDEFIGADVTEPASFSALACCGPFDAVVHCAGAAHRFGRVTDGDYCRVNIDGTRNIARFAGENGVKRFVHLSSVLVYGRHGIGITEADECKPHDAYATSKLASEEAAIEIGRKAGMAVTVLRPAPVVGEGCKGNFARLIRTVDRGRFVNVGSGQARKSIVYVGDVAEACVRAIEAVQARGAEIFNLAGETITANELLDAIYQSLGKNGPGVSLPAGPIRLVLAGAMLVTRARPVSRAARSLETWTSDDVYATDAIRERIGFVAKTPPQEAIRRTVAAYKAEARV